jgi:hypothetical protein
MLDAATLKTMKISRFERVGFVFVFKRIKCSKDKNGTKALILPSDRNMTVSIDT